MIADEVPAGRRQRAKEDKRRRILASARSLFAERGMTGVTTQEIADGADVAIGTLFLYAATKAELLIMVQNEKFSDAIDAGLEAARRAEAAGASVEQVVVALIDPVVACIREHPENGRLYLHELVFGDATEPHRRAGLALSLRLESDVIRILADRAGVPPTEAEPLARVVSSIIHMTTTATIHLDETPSEILAAIRRQLAVILPRATSEVGSLGVSAASGSA